MSAPLRVLLVEDSPTDAKLVVAALGALGRPIEHERVEERSAMRAALERVSWDIVLSDWSMPRFSALLALEVLKQSGHALPFIIVSGTIGEERAADAMRAGAQDYVLKDRLARLAPAVARELREAQERVAKGVAEEALRVSELRFRRLWESGLMLINIGEPTGRIADVNEAGLRMVGYTLDELTSKQVTWTDLTPPEWHPADASARAELKAKGVAGPWEKELLHKDGHRVPILASVATLDEGGRGVGGIGIAIDLTERKRAESKLCDTENQLLQAQKMEAVGRLAGGVAHDFNNMLSVILSYSDLLFHDLAPDDPHREDLSEITRAGQRAASLTRQLLTFSRQQVVAPRVLDLNEVLGDMSKMLPRLLGEDIELELRPGAVGRVRVDPTSIEQVVMNLAVNARDAMPTGGKLTIETSSVVLDETYAREHVGVKPGPHVLLAVTDTGVGMDTATQAHVFEPFFTTKEVGKGTGLGLSTVFGIVMQSGGSIWLHSEPGRGTSFKVYLPRVDEAAEAVAPSTAPTTLRGTETVLLVEDEAHVRAVARSILARSGYNVLVAGGAAEAIVHCEQHRGAIHLLLTDIVMPKMSGPELATKLVAMRSEMRVLCMSGYTDDSIARHGFLESGAAFLQKPFTPETLTWKVREVLEATKTGSFAI
jgi:PAS domain S-box-containing protein